MKDIAPSLSSIVSERSETIKTSLTGYKGYFGNHTYPVDRQISNFKRKNALPPSAVPALLLSLEIRSGGLFGLHDLARVYGQIVFDTASDGESFEGISGKLVRCTAHEPILRDDRGIIASLFQGPDKRTAAEVKANEEEMNWAFVLLGYPSMPQSIVDQMIHDATETFALLKSAQPKIWVGYGH